MSGWRGFKGGGNPDIARIGRDYQFGKEKGPDPSKAGHVGGLHRTSVRGALKRIACSEFDLTKPMTPEAMGKVFGGKGTILTGAQLIAIKKVSQAMGNWQAMDGLIDAIDGKQVSKTVEAKITLAELIAKSYDKEYLEGEDEDDGEPGEDGGA